MLQLRDDLTKELQGALDNEGEARLPFPAPVFWVMNGNASLKQTNDARYFGGWATSAEELEDAAESIGAKIPALLQKVEFVPKSGESVNVYITRSLPIVPIRKRLSSVNKDTGERFPGYHKGASPHLQVLAYVALVDKQGEKASYQPWMPIVLSAKGYQAGHVLDAFQKWSTKTAQARRQFTQKLSADVFYCNVGTFGKTINSIQVGGAKSSPITPLELYIPEQIAEATLTNRFIGEGLAAEIVTLKEQATEWANAWGKPMKETPANGNGDTPAESPEEPEDLPEEEMAF